MSRKREIAARIWTRWYRELGGLAVFLLIFYGVIVWTQGSNDATGSDDVNASQMTKARIYSDAAFRQSDFAEAAIHLQDLVNADPFNPHARFQLALCYHNQFVRTHATLNRSEPSAEDTRGKLESRLEELRTQAEAMFRRCTNSHRYRGRSLFYLARMFGLSRDREKTLAALGQFLDRNYTTNRGIARSSEFRFLRDDPEFKKLVMREQQANMR